MRNEKWGFFSDQPTVTLTAIAERLAVVLSLPVFTTKVCRSSDLNTQPSACEVNALMTREKRVVSIEKRTDVMLM